MSADHLDGGVWPDPGRAIRALRKRAGLRQKELAARAGLMAPSLARIENGPHVPRLDTVVRLLEACGLELEIAEIREAPAEAAPRLAGMTRLSPGDRLRTTVRPGHQPFRLLRAVTVVRRHLVILGDSAAAIRGAPVDPATLQVAVASEEVRGRLMEALGRMHAKRLSGPGRVGTIAVVPPPPPFASYEELASVSEPVELDPRPTASFEVLVPPLFDLLRIARHGRSKEDLERAELLAATRRAARSRR